MTLRIAWKTATKLTTLKRILRKRTLRLIWEDSALSNPIKLRSNLLITRLKSSTFIPDCRPLRVDLPRRVPKGEIQTHRPFRSPTRNKMYKLKPLMVKYTKGKVLQGEFLTIFTRRKLKSNCRLNLLRKCIWPRLSKKISSRDNRNMPWRCSLGSRSSRNRRIRRKSRNARSNLVQKERKRLRRVFWKQSQLFWRMAPSLYHSLRGILIMTPINSSILQLKVNLRLRSKCSKSPDLLKVCPDRDRSSSKTRRSTRRRSCKTSIS